MSDNNIKELILNNRPKLSLGSYNTYMSSYRNMKKNSKIPMNTPEEIIENHKEIIEFLMETTPMIRKSKLSCFIVIIDDKKSDDKDLATALEAFRKQMYLDADTVKDKELEQDLTDKQKENLIPQEDVMKIYNQLKDEASPLLKLQKLNKRQFMLLQQYILLSLYVLIPPRRSLDYTYFKIRNFDTSEKSTDNYMMKGKNKKDPSYFIFNTYKTARRLGRQAIEIPKTLEKLIDSWTDFNQTDFLLINSVNKSVAGSKIALWLNEIFGKNISTNMLRHIYLTDKYSGINLKEITDTANAMGQSDISRTLKYVQKNEEE